MICTNLPSDPTGVPLHAPDGAIDPHDPGGHVQWLQLDLAQHGRTSKVFVRNCVFLTKSTDIEDYNFLAWYKHGNGRGSGMKLSHWNMGGAFLINSMAEIEQTIAEYKPHILGISEANFHAHHSGRQNFLFLISIETGNM